MQTFTEIVPLRFRKQELKVIDEIVRLELAKGEPDFKSRSDVIRIATMQYINKIQRGRKNGIMGKIFW